MYARALFEAAKDEGRLDAVHEELGDFVRAAGDVPELGALLAQPAARPAGEGRRARGPLGGADEIVRNFLLLLVEKGRAGELDEIRASSTARRARGAAARWSS